MCSHYRIRKMLGIVCRQMKKKDRTFQEIKRTNTAQTRINSNLLWQCKKCMKFCSAKNIRRSYGTALAGICCSEFDELFEVCFTFLFKAERKIARVIASTLHSVYKFVFQKKDSTWFDSACATRPGGIFNFFLPCSPDAKQYFPFMMLYSVRRHKRQLDSRQIDG